MSAAGMYVPPMLIFPRVRMNDELKIGAPAGTLFRAHPSGWMQCDLFVDWFKHFLVHTKPTKDDPVLLILDGHVSHTKNLQFLDLARENHVTVVSLPPHCTHRLQPLDVSFMSPLKTYYSKAIEKFHRDTKGQPVKQANISQLFAEAYAKAAQQTTAENGFRHTGLYPLDRKVFSDEDFAHSNPSPIKVVPKTQFRSRRDSIWFEDDLLGFELSKPVTSDQSSKPVCPEQGPEGPQESTSLEQSPKPGPSERNREEKEEEPTPRDSTLDTGAIINTEPKASLDNDHGIRFRPSDIMPLPGSMVQSNAPKRGRVAEKAAVLTSDNFIKQLRQKKQEKENKDQDLLVTDTEGPKKRRRGVTSTRKNKKLAKKTVSKLPRE
ncbi:uncharacterized protein LOC134289633 [Aedes albopictus]|uniref:DDE-1 domain-containing protein n=1 Tax=Aedes albopictus TaxID=7160 RepID=A0ABM1YT41_AEDAL